MQQPVQIHPHDPIGYHDEKSEGMGNTTRGKDGIVDTEYLISTISALLTELEREETP